MPWRSEAIKLRAMHEMEHAAYDGRLRRQHPWYDDNRRSGCAIAQLVYGLGETVDENMQKGVTSDEHPLTEALGLSRSELRYIRHVFEHGNPDIGKTLARLLH